MAFKLFGKKEKTQEEEIEEYMVVKYRLTKDLEVPNRYWINNDIFIDFIPGDKESCKNAEVLIQEYYRKPSLQQANTAQKMTRGNLAKAKKGNFFERAAEGGILKGFEEVGNNFMKSAPNATDELSGLGANTMRDGLKNAERLGGVNSSQWNGINQNPTMEVSPKIDMDTILGQVKQPQEKKPPVKKPVAKKRAPK
jgi:hypothetical protein